MRKLALLLMLLAAPSAYGAICTAAEINTAMNDSNIPQGTSGTVTLTGCTSPITLTATVAIPNTKGVTLDGNGYTITGSGALPLITLAQHATLNSRITNFGVNWLTVVGVVAVRTTGSPSSAPFRIDNNNFSASEKAIFGSNSGNGPGLVDHNTFTSPGDVNGQSEQWHNISYGDGVTTGWANALTPLSQPLSGAVYYEDNTFTNSAPYSPASDYFNAGFSAIQCFNGARCIFRFNTVNNALLDVHGGAVSGRYWEFYANQWYLDPMFTPIYTAGFIDPRGGTGFSFENTMKPGSASAGTGNSSWGAQVSQDEPLYKIGQGQNPPSLDPAYNFKNHASLNLVRSNCAQGIGTGCTASYVLTANTDYYNGTTTVNTSQGNPFTGGSGGVGFGPVAFMPATCTAGVGYWATNEGSWNDGSNPIYTGQGQFYKCVATDDWDLYYTPYTYPHPLISGFPTPGNSGTITTASVTPTTLTLNWTEATDAVTPQADLEYEVCQSLTNTVTTVAGCEAATIIQMFTPNLDTLDVTSLTALTTYYFNVVVKNDAGNKAAYDGVTIATTCGATKVVFTDQPANATLGNSLGTIIVQVQNAASTLCTDSSASVVLSKNASATWNLLTTSGSGVPGLTLAATAGVATWTDVFISPTVGAGAIDANSSGLTVATSNSVTITAPVASSQPLGKMRKRPRAR